MDKAQDKIDIDEELLEICNLAQEGFCIKKKWGKCLFPDTNDDDGHKCGLCFAIYIIDKLGYRKPPDKVKKVSMGGFNIPHSKPPEGKLFVEVDEAALMDLVEANKIAWGINE